MLLAMDIGNTNIKVGLFDGKKQVQYYRISTSRDRSSDEYGLILESLFTHNGYALDMVHGVMISSVVPTVNYTIEHMCRAYLDQEALFLGPGVRTGINIKYENPRDLGSDRIANAVAAYDIYGGPTIFIDFGTATTYGVVSEKGEFLGGAISPGVKLSADVLVSGAAKLPRVELEIPAEVVGRTTVTNIQSGLLFSIVGAVDYITGRMKRELNAPQAKVVATGGMARLIAQEAQSIDEIDGLLTLKGLQLIYERNQ